MSAKSAYHPPPERRRPGADVKVPFENGHGVGNLVFCGAETVVVDPATQSVPIGGPPNFGACLGILRTDIEVAAEDRRRRDSEVVGVTETTWSRAGHADQREPADGLGQHRTGKAQERDKNSNDTKIIDISTSCQTAFDQYTPGAPRIWLYFERFTSGSQTIGDTALPKDTGVTEELSRCPCISRRIPILLARLRISREAPGFSEPLSQ